MKNRGRIYNTFDAHRLLYWAASEGKQKELKRALLEAYFTRGLDPSDASVLIDIVRRVGLNVQRAQTILASTEFTENVRAEQAHIASLGIQAVPSINLNDKYLLQGGQPPEVFERALRQVANEVVGA
jgi:predicted DsbA family dithiol-disulfide isomerase